MRITTNMSYQRSIRSLQDANERLDQASQQMSSGNKFSTAGEDPIGMSQKLNLSSKIETYNQYNTNGGLLSGSLSLEETVLNSVNTGLESAYSLVQKSNNSAYSASDRASIATELGELQKQMFDLMNSKNADGEYIFGGNQSQTQPFVIDSTGKYIFQGDTGQRQIQVAPSVQIAANDSGLGLFQSIPTRRTATATSANLTLSIADQGQFETYYRNNYNFSQVPSATANNTFTVNTTALPSTYTILDSGGNTLQTGAYQQGTAINFNGLSVTLNVAAGAGGETFKLDQPQNDNILNTLSNAIAVLKNPASTSTQISTMIADTESHLSNSRDKINSMLGEIGGRMNNLDEISATNTSLTTITTEERASVSEIDIYEAYTKVVKEQTALSAAQQAYSQVHKSSLFDYIQ